ncbi:protein-tyrosine kinase 2-beta-like [Babylonia areolata]|uniref:protein-tyrosine kinase 2-beta-like n=1 Tax=Babylonia areolata TaxID=304850 RepID=UPI003FD6956E
MWKRSPEPRSLVNTDQKLYCDPCRPPATYHFLVAICENTDWAINRNISGLFLWLDLLLSDDETVVEADHSKLVTDQNTLNKNVDTLKANLENIRTHNGRQQRDTEKQVWAIREEVTSQLQDLTTAEQTRSAQVGADLHRLQSDVADLHRDCSEVKNQVAQYLEDHRTLAADQSTTQTEIHRLEVTVRQLHSDTDEVRRQQQSVQAELVKLQEEHVGPVLAELRHNHHSLTSQVNTLQINVDHIKVALEESLSKTSSAIAELETRLGGDQPKSDASAGKEDTTIRTLHHDQIRMEKSLGSGIFAIGVQGTCREQDQVIPVMVKMPNVGKHDLGSQQRLIHEAKMMAKLDHTYIVRLIGVCEEKGPLMVVMELAKLGPLDMFLRNHSQFPVRTIMELLYQVCQALEYLEAQQVVHCFVRCRNVLLFGEHLAKLSSFTLAHSLSGRDTVTDPVWEEQLITAKWLAPESIKGRRFNSKSDVWSFGVTLWEALTYGAVPWTKLTADKMVDSLDKGHRLAKPVCCTDRTYDVMLQCWQKSPEDRPTFKELVRTMEGLCQGY